MAAVVRLGLSLLAALAIPIALTSPAQADALRIEGAWARASIGTSRPAAAYFTIVNGSATDDQLVAVASEVAGTASVHRTVSHGDVMRMEPVGALPIAAGETLQLAPGGLHVMLMDLKRPLKKGMTVTLSLRFDKAGPVDVTAIVAGLGAITPAQ